MDERVISDFRGDMRLRGLSEVTIRDRIELVRRLAAWLHPAGLLDASEDELVRWQRQVFGPLAPASRDIYGRHVIAFYRWAWQRHLIDADPSDALVRTKVRRGRPHPVPPDLLRAVFACTTGPLRIAYLLAAFASARCGEIARLSVNDLDLTPCAATVTLDGKGGKVRTVPLLAPVVAELLDYGIPRAGAVLLRAGIPYTPEQLSSDSHNHLRRLGFPTTLHSFRHTFATMTLRSTHDLMLVKELLGHESVATTQIYTEPDMADLHARLAAVADLARSVTGPRRLRAVS